MSLLTNGGFETGNLTGWTVAGGWSGGPVGVFNTLDVYEGTYACWLGTRYNPSFGFDDDSSVSQAFTTVPGEEYTATVYLCVPTALPDKSASATIQIALIDAGSSTVLAENRFAQSTLQVGTFEARRVTATATGTSTRLRVQVANDGVTNGTWYAMLDGCVVPEASNMAILNALRSALVSDLESVTTGNGYSLTVQQVYTEPKLISEMQKPGIYLAPDEGGDVDTDTLTNRIGAASQRYTVALVVNTQTPNSTLDNFTDDVRNAIEKSASNLLTTANVIDVTVDSISPVLVDSDVSREDYIRLITVTVQYEYTRGSA